MTYGTLDGTLPPTDPAPKYVPQSYGGGLYTDSSKGAIDPGALPTIPTIPGIPANGNRGNTSVDTSSLKTFADNLDKLADMIDGAKSRVDNLPDLAAGGVHFKEAQDLNKTVTGDGGLRPNFSKALHDLQTALMDTANNIRALANKYSTIEEINEKGGTELRDLMQTAQSELQTLASDTV